MISWTDCVKNEEVLHEVKSILNTTYIKRTKANRIDHILRSNCLVKYILE
jgi:hypothetical protein